MQAHPFSHLYNRAFAPPHGVELTIYQGRTESHELKEWMWELPSFPEPLVFSHEASDQKGTQGAPKSPISFIMQRRSLSPKEGVQAVLSRAVMPIRAAEAPASMSPVPFRLKGGT